MARLTPPAQAGNFILRAAGFLALSALTAFAVLAGLWPQGRAALPSSADVAIVLAGSYDRALYAADLYKSGKVQRIAVSRPVAEPVHKRLAALGITVTREDEMTRLILERSGVPAMAIDTLPGAAASTRDEAVAIARYVQDNNKRIIVVASPYSRRRTEWIVSRFIAPERLQVVATPYEEFDWRWWQSPSSARAIVVELMKILYLAIAPAATA